jgi:hypothetical protein
VSPDDDVTQFCVEEAVFARLEIVERHVKANIPDVEGLELGDDGSVPGISPGQAQAAEHAARMAELRGG